MPPVAFSAAIRPLSRLAGMRHRRFSVSEYERLVAAGELTENDRCELIRGVITDKMGIGDLHAACVNRLNWLFNRAAGEQFLVSIQNPIRLSDSVPEPDCVLAAFRADYYGQAKPVPAEVLLLIEVADSSLDSDRQIKLPLYAENHIREYWIVNLIDECLEVYRQPQGSAYGQRVELRRGQTVSPLALPALSITVESILGTPTAAPAE